MEQEQMLLDNPRVYRCKSGEIGDGEEKEKAEWVAALKREDAWFPLPDVAALPAVLVQI